MMALSPEKKFVVEVATLQSMQQLIQWVADLTLYLLASVPLVHGGAAAFPGETLLRDARVLGVLRELLVVIRIWGLINSACLPYFTTTAAGVDHLAQLFRLLTCVWKHAAAKDGTRDFDDALVDECCTVSAQLMLPALDEGLFGNLDCAMPIYAQSSPVKYTFGDAPVHPAPSSSSVHSTAPWFVFPHGHAVSRHRKDVVRQITLGNLGSGKYGVRPADATRLCVRCSCASLLRSVSKSPAVNIFDFAAVTRVMIF